jgi:hypothetical protein
MHTILSMRPQVPRLTYACKQCGAPKEITEAERRNGRGSFCSVRCGALWRTAHGQFKRTRRWEDDPHLCEFVALLFPDASNREIARAVGLNAKRIEHFARTGGLRKSERWMKANGYSTSNQGPTDPAQREVWALRLTLKGEITKRSREVAP